MQNYLQLLKEYCNNLTVLENVVFAVYPELQGNSSVKFRLNGAGKATVKEFGGHSLGDLGACTLAKFLHSLGDFNRQYNLLRQFANEPQNELIQHAKAKPKTTNTKPQRAFAQFVQDWFLRPIGAGIEANYLAKKTGANLALCRKIGVYTYPNNVSEKDRNICFHSGQAIKRKYFNRTKTDSQNGLNKYGFSHTTDYNLFGANCLDTAKDHLIFCEGETDCLALIAAGFNAVTLGSVSDYQTQTQAAKDAILAAANGFKTVFVWLDITKQDQANKANAQVIARNFANKYGFVWVDFEGFLGFLDMPKPKNGFDICDLYQINKNAFAQFVQDAISLNSRLDANPNDPQSFGLDHIIKIEFNQYLSEKFNTVLAIAALQKHYKKIALSSVAGTGKTRLFLELAKTFWASEKVVICFPTNAILGQFANDLQAQQMPFGRLEKGLATKGDLLGNELAHSLIICTYDSSKYIKQLPNWESAFFIIDEFHQLGQDSSFRALACEAVFSLATGAKNVLLASATPDLLYCSNVLPCFNYKLIQCKEQVKNKVEIDLIQTPKGFKSVDYFEQVEARFNPSTGALLQVENSKKHNSYLANALALRGIQSADISSQNKEDSEVYKQILDNSQTDCLGLFSTCLIEAGVSIKSPVSLVSVINFFHASKLVQVATRPRLNGQNNALVKCVFFVGERQNTVPSKTSLQLFNELYKGALSEAGKEKKYRAKTDLDKFLDKDGNILFTQILRAVFEAEEKASTPQLIKSRLEFFDNRFSVEICDILTPEKDLQYKAVAMLDKAAKQVLEQQTQALAQSNFDLFALATIGASKKDAQEKQDQKNVLALPIMPKADIKEFFNNNKDFINGLGMSYLAKVQKLIELGQSKEDAISKASTVTKTKLEQAQTLATHQKRKSEGLAGLRDEKEAAKIEQVKEVLSQRKRDASRGKAKEFLSPSELAAIVNRALEKAGTQKAALKNVKNVVSYVSTFFELERKTVQGQKLYKIASTKTQIDL